MVAMSGSMVFDSFRRNTAMVVLLHSLVIFYNMKFIKRCEFSAGKHQVMAFQNKMTKKW